MRWWLPLVIILTACGGGEEQKAGARVLRVGHFPNVTHAHGVVAHHLTRTGHGLVRGTTRTGRRDRMVRVQCRAERHGGALGRVHRPDVRGSESPRSMRTSGAAARRCGWWPVRCEAGPRWWWARTPASRAHRTFAARRWPRPSSATRRTWSAAPGFSTTVSGSRRPAATYSWCPPRIPTSSRCWRAATWTRPGPWSRGCRVWRWRPARA